MNSFKKSFRGYRAADVDQRLHELESQLNAAQARITALEKQLAEAGQAADQIRAELQDRSAELEKWKSRYEKLRLEQSTRKNPAESIGRVYIKAFESGREIVMAPTPYVEQYLADIESAAEKSEQEISDAKRDFAEASDKIAAVIAQIDQQTQFMTRRLGDLAAGIEEVSRVYIHVEQVKDAAKADIGQIRSRYEQALSEYTDDSSFAPAMERELELGPFVFSADETMLTSDKTDLAEDIPESEGSLAVSPTPPAAPSDNAPDYAALDPRPLPPSADSIPAANQAGISGQPPAAPSGKTDETSGSDEISSAESEQDEQTQRPETVDTSADFRNENSGSTAAQMFFEPGMASGTTQKPSGEVVRGQNILNLLNKYQKK